MTQKELSKILFLDIETVSVSKDYKNLSTPLKEAWCKKINTYAEKEGVSIERAYKDRAGIFAEFGKIVVISVGYFYEKNNVLKFRVKSLSSHDEKKILTDFDVLLKTGFSCFCAHNGKEFDYPYLSRRFLINGLQLPKLLNMQGKKPWQIPHFDTLDLWRFGDYKNYTSLDTLCAVFDIKSSKSDIDGSMVSQVYHDFQDLNRIAKYCNQDVIATAQVFLRLNQMETLSSECIEEVEIPKEEFQLT